MSTLVERCVKVPYLAEPIQENNFFRWSGPNFYRTSYNDMRAKVSFSSPIYTLHRLLWPTSAVSCRNMQDTSRHCRLRTCSVALARNCRVRSSPGNVWTPGPISSPPPGTLVAHVTSTCVDSTAGVFPAQMTPCMLPATDMASPPSSPIIPAFMYSVSYNTIT